MPENTSLLPSHLEWLLNNLSNHLQTRLQKEKVVLLDREAIAVFADADPTEGLVLVDWLVKLYCGDGFRWEDIASGKNSKVAQTLVLFTQHRHRLEAGKQTVYSYKNIAALYKSIQPFLEKEKTPPMRDIKQEAQERAMRESRIIYRDARNLVAVPLTVFASCWWGQGTRWCTASRKEEDNYFDRYNADAPLIIIQLKDNQNKWRKLQLYCELHDFQFMDEADEEVALDFIEQHWEQLAPIMEWAVDQTGFALEYIPASKKSCSLCERAVEKAPEAIQWVPEELLTAELGMSVIKRDGTLIEYLPAERKNPEACRIAVESAGLALCLVPSEFVTRELCMLAVRNIGSAIMFVPEQFKDGEMYSQAVLKDGHSLSLIPNDQKTSEMCWQAIKIDGLSLVHVPKAHLTQQMCLSAVEQNGQALIHVPPEFKDLEICGIAVENCSFAIHSVPEHLMEVLRDISEKTAAREKEEREADWAEKMTGRWKDKILDTLQEKLESELGWERGAIQNI